MKEPNVFDITNVNQKKMWHIFRNPNEEGATRILDAFNSLGAMQCSYCKMQGKAGDFTRVEFSCDKDHKLVLEFGSSYQWDLLDEKHKQ